jgi:sulfoxide reductase heme-binding subunit YedZ
VVSTLAATSPLLWYSTRASGIIALVLLTASVVLGLLSATRLSTSRWPRFAVNDLHRRISLLSVLFVALHVVTAASDSFVPIGWLAIVVPFTSAYKSFWVGLGTVAFDCLAAIALTSVFRSRLRPAVWRGIHWLAYLSWPVAVAHGLAMGTDTRFGWAALLVAACCVSVTAAFLYRVVAAPPRVGPGKAAASEVSADLARRGALAPPPVPERVR